MIGAIAGDIIGSYWEFREEKVSDRKEKLFRSESTITDDSILTIATAEAILRNRFYTDCYQDYCRRFVNYGYGPSFMQWAHTSESYTKPNHSYGNGAAMRVSPIGWAFNSLQRVLMEAQQSASITHCHTEGIKAAQATSVAIFMARNGASKDQIRTVMQEWFEYLVDIDLDEYHREYQFDVSSQGTLPPAIACVLQADSFEDVMRNGLYIGGDCDTLLAIAGGIAEPMFGVPKDIREQAEEMLYNHGPTLLGTLREFEKKFGAGVVANGNQCGVLGMLKSLFNPLGK